jgi:hypothetical protein
MGGRATESERGTTRLPFGKRARRRKIGSAAEVFRTAPTLERVPGPVGSQLCDEPGAWRRATTRVRQDGQAELRGSVGRPEARGEGTTAERRSSSEEDRAVRVAETNRVNEVGSRSSRPSGRLWSPDREDQVCTVRWGRSGFDGARDGRTEWVLTDTEGDPGTV